MRMLPVLILAGLLASTAMPATAQVLYQPAQNPPELINTSPWNWNFTTTGGMAPAVGTTGTVLNSIPATNDKQGGFNISNGGSYNNPLMPVISAATGYLVRFTVAVTAEQHDNEHDQNLTTDDDRAGFSIIAVSSNNAKAIELGFFIDRIFSQNSNFVGRGEEIGINTTAMTTYDLAIVGNGYTLSSGNTALLQGNLRAYNQNGNFINDLIYSQTNWIFMGDDTHSAAATVEIAHVEILPVPEPTSLMLLGIGALGLTKRACGRRCFITQK